MIFILKKLFIRLFRIFTPYNFHIFDPFLTAFFPLLQISQEILQQTKNNAK